MLSILSTSVSVFILYLWLTAGSGRLLGLWSAPELILGALLSLLTGALTRLHCGERGGLVNPLRWLKGLVYAVGPFFFEMAKANFDVAYRVITGRIRPGIIRVRSGMESDVSTLFLANSITLTPGTLTVGVDEETNDLFIHKIHLKPGEEEKPVWEARELFTLNLPAWIRSFSR